MENPLAISLIVSSIGLLFLFLALALLYGLMYLMTSAIKDPPTSPVLPPEHKGVPGNKEEMLRAATIAVALARADQEFRPARSLAADEIVSPWWVLHHQRGLARSSHTRRAR